MQTPLVLAVDSLSVSLLWEGPDIQGNDKGRGGIWVAGGQHRASVCILPVLVSGHEAVLGCVKLAKT